MTETPNWEGVRDRVLRFIREGWDRPASDDTFDALARGVFAFQFRENAPYRAWCERRQRTPDQVSHWSEIPAVPTGAFKEVALVSGVPASVDVVFRTSGTTQGSAKRGAHYVRDIALYEASLRASFQAMLLPDARALDMLSLLPPAADMPDSSLAHMVDEVMRAFGGAGSAHFATIADGIDAERLNAALRASERDGRAVCLLGTSLSFVHWFEHIETRGWSYELTAGSRLMDTGGFKGKTRAVPEHELRDRYTRRLGIRPEYCINEYGMTEMASQFYDVTLRDLLLGTAADREPSGAERLGTRTKRGPPWVRTRAVDPDTLAPLPAGHTGLLQHFDLANAGSVLAVQTEDLGILEGDGFRLLGRATGAPPRGCSIAMDELLAAARP